MLTDARQRMQSHSSLGYTYQAVGRSEEAIEHYRQALSHAKELDDRQGKGAILGNLGLAYAALGRVEEAITQYEQALLIAREIGDRRNEGAILGNLGLAYAPAAWRKRVPSLPLPDCGLPKKRLCHRPTEIWSYAWDQALG